MTCSTPRSGGSPDGSANTSEYCCLSASTCCRKSACSRSAGAEHVVVAARVDLAAVSEEKVVTSAAATVTLATSAGVTSTRKERQPCFNSLASLSTTQHKLRNEISKALSKGSMLISTVCTSSCLVLSRQGL